MRVLALLLSVAASIWLRPAVGQPVSDDGRAKFWITFVDKNNGTGKAPAAVETDLISERARARRLRRGGAVRSDLDVPVSSHYQNRLRALGVEPIIRSRWLNAVSAYLTPEQSRIVSRLPFVLSVTTVARRIDPNPPPQPNPDIRSQVDLGELRSGKNAGQNSRLTTTALDYGASLAQLQSINAIEPIENGFIGEGLLLGFLDTTTDTLHPAFQHLVDSGRVVAVRDFATEAGLAPQTNQHGLNTSSTALAFDEGELIGACYGAEYIFATTEYAPFERNQEEDFFVAGMEWMEQMGADIVNVSLGYSIFDAGQDSYTYEDMDGKTAKTTIASDIAVGLGIVVVVSAGNSGCSSPNDCWYYILSPADGDSVITAGAVYLSGNRVGFSSRGPTFDGRIKPDVAALGSSVRFAVGSGGYGSGSGTSFSAPLVSSVACQILQANPNLNPIEVRTLLRSTASQATNPDNNKGWGVINAAEAVRLATDPDTTAPVLLGMTFSPDIADVTTGHVDVNFRVRASDDLSGVRAVRVCLADPSGGEDCEVSSSPDSGDALSGRWTVPITIPKLSETGTWHVSHVVVYDSVVSSVDHDSTALATSGYPTEVEVVVRFNLAATVILEGPYSGAGSMSVGATHLAAMPLEHPFDSSAYAGTPLFYEGSESVVSLPSGVVDWILVGLRSDSSSASTLGSLTQAVFLLEDGSIVDTSGADPTFYVDSLLSYYVVLRTRNHGSVMTPVPIDFSSGLGAWDFTDSLGAAFTEGPPPLIDLGAGFFGMFACDINYDHQITAPDFNMWLVATKAVSTGYLQEDCTLDGHVTASDFNFWLTNTKAVAGSQVLE